MSEGKQNPDELLAQGSNAAVELTETDLDNASGASPKLLTSINDITFGIQKDKMQSANKNAEAVRGLL